MIKLPKKYSVHVKTELGTIDIKWIIGNLRVEGDTTNNIKINYMKGAADISTDVGNIKAAINLAPETENLFTASTGNIEVKGAGKIGIYFSASADVGKIEFSN